MINYIESVFIPYDITIIEKMTRQAIVKLYLDLKDVETIFEAIIESAYIHDEVKNLKN